MIAIAEAFVEDGGDRSIDSANRIEVALHELSGNEGHYDNEVEQLALYRPFGGDHLIGEQEMVACLRWVLVRLRRAAADREHG